MCCAASTDMEKALLVACWWRQVPAPTGRSVLDWRCEPGAGGQRGSQSRPRRDSRRATGPTVPRGTRWKRQEATTEGGVCGSIDLAWIRARGTSRGSDGPWRQEAPSSQLPSVLRSLLCVLRIFPSTPFIGPTSLSNLRTPGPKKCPNHAKSRQIQPPETLLVRVRVCWNPSQPLDTQPG